MDALLIDRAFPVKKGKEPFPYPTLFGRIGRRQQGDTDARRRVEQKTDQTGVKDQDMLPASQQHSSHAQGPNANPGKGRPAA